MINLFLFLKRTYNIMYVIEYKYFQRIWGSFAFKKNIIPFNVTLTMTLSFVCFFYSIILFIDFIIGQNLFLYFFSNKFLIYILVGVVLGLHHYCYEFKSKYLTVLKDYEFLEISKSKYITYFILTNIYIYGSIISLIVLAILSVDNS